MYLQIAVYHVVIAASKLWTQAVLGGMDAKAPMTPYNVVFSFFRELQRLQHCGNLTPCYNSATPLLCDWMPRDQCSQNASISGETFVSLIVCQQCGPKDFV